MFAERVPESPRLARLARYVLRLFTFGRCFYTFLVVLLITTATMMVTFLLGFIAGNVPIQRASRLQVLHRPSTK